jgi:hypothetical protein
VICHVTTVPGATVTDAGEKLVPAVVTMVEPGVPGVGDDGAPVPGGLTGFSSTGVLGGPSIAAPPPPQPIVTARDISSSRSFGIESVIEVCAQLFAFSLCRVAISGGIQRAAGGERLSVGERNSCGEV